jgi:hypothetical protein
MNWDAVGAIAEVAGVLGIVISLVYVGVQVRQNTMQLRQDNLRETMRGTLDNYWYFHRNDAAFEIFRQGCVSFEELPPKDKAHFHSIVVDLSFYFGLVLEMHHAGLVDDIALEMSERFFLAVLSTPGGKQWWEFARRTKPLPESAIDHIQALMDSPETSFKPITELQPWFAS